MNNSIRKEKIYLEIALGQGLSPQMGREDIVDINETFENVILKVLNQDNYIPDPKIRDWIVYKGRSPSTRFFPIGATEKQIRYFEST